MTTLLLFLIALADPNVLPLPMDIALYNPDNSGQTMFVRIIKCTQVSEKDWDIRYERFNVCDNIEALRTFARCWLDASEPTEPHFNLHGFVHLSRHWPGDPNYTPPVVEQPDTLGEICYTLGGKHHLYQDCRYLVGKEWTPCECDPNNLCLICVARKVRE